MQTMSTHNASSKRSGLPVSADACADLILMGVIGKPKGVRGQVWIYSYAQNPGDIASYGALTDPKTNRTFQLKAGEVKGSQVVVSIDGVADRNMVESLRGVKLYVSRGALPPLQNGRYYHTDLIGLSAETQNGEMVGKVIDVYNYGAGDVIEIATANSDDPLCLPFHNQFVISVDMNAGKMIVEIPVMVELEEGEQDA